MGSIIETVIMSRYIFVTSSGEISIGAREESTIWPSASMILNVGMAFLGSVEAKWREVVNFEWMAPGNCNLVLMLAIRLCREV